MWKVSLSLERGAVESPPLADPTRPGGCGVEFLSCHTVMGTSSAPLLYSDCPHSHTIIKLVGAELVTGGLLVSDPRYHLLSCCVPLGKGT